tara:strand:+ start:20865 stop:21266 length:402 start_codon:yes stop_codon:yes gene_type:complete
MTQQRSNTKTPERTNEAKKPPRIKMNSGNKLAAPKREGYQRYWAITGPDHPGKLEQMQAAYWDFVEVDGKRIEQAAGKGNTHVLMEIEQRYYDEDMQDQQKRAIDATQKNTQALGDSEYVPLGQKNVVEREII